MLSLPSALLLPLQEALVSPWPALNLVPDFSWDKGAGTRAGKRGHPPSPGQTSAMVSSDTQFLEACL